MLIGVEKATNVVSCEAIEGLREFLDKDAGLEAEVDEPETKVLACG